MIMLSVLALWVTAFWSHEFLQPRTRAAFPHQTRFSVLYKSARALAPCCALALCLFQNPALGVPYWLGLGSVAGVMTSLLIAVLKQKRGLARMGKPPF